MGLYKHGFCPGLHPLAVLNAYVVCPGKFQTGSAAHPAEEEQLYATVQSGSSQPAPPLQRRQPAPLDKRSCLINLAIL